MSEFTTSLIVSPLDDGKRWRLVKELTYHIGSADSDNTVTAVCGFCTDFASVPRLFWWVIPKWGKYGNGAVIHDWLYWEQKRTRTEADDILLEAMDVFNVAPWKKQIIYYAVRLFGWIAWMRNAGEKKNDFNRVLQTEQIKATFSSKRPGTLNSIYTYMKNTR
jgi:hypothetical protein